MRQTKGAIGNLLNRYKAVLKKCNLLNTFGSLAVASMLVMGGAGVAQAEGTWTLPDGTKQTWDNSKVVNANTELSGTFQDYINDSYKQKAGVVTIDRGTTGVTVLDNTSFINNSTTVSEGGAGGAIKALDGFTIGNNVTFSGNSAVEGGWGGGAIYIRLTQTENDEVTIGQDAKFINNTAKNLGGAIALEYGTLTIEDGARFEGNSITNADGDNGGGAIAVWHDTRNGNNEAPHPELNVTGAEFISNSSAISGGAIYNYDGTIEVTDSTFTGNTSSNMGGAIANLSGPQISDYKFTGTVKITNSIFDGNTSANGGAVWQGTDGETVIEGSEFYNNKAIKDRHPAQQGGAITNASTMTIRDTIFQGNEAGMYGGAIASVAPQGGDSYKPDLTLSDVTVTSNRAGQYGGGIYNASTNTLAFEGTNTITGNQSGTGENLKDDDLYNLGTANINSGTTTVDALYNTGEINIGGDSAATLKVNESWTDDNGTTNVKNLGTLSVTKEVLYDAEGNLNENINATVNSGATLAVTGLDDMSLEEVKSLKDALTNENFAGSLYLGDINITDLKPSVEGHGHYAYSDIKDITGVHVDQLLEGTVDVKDEENTGIGGGFKNVHLTGDDKTLIAKGKDLTLAGSEEGGNLVFYGEVGSEELGNLRIGSENSKDVSNGSNTIVTLGRADANNQGTLGNVTMNAGDGKTTTLNVVGKGEAVFTAGDILTNGSTNQIVIDGATFATGNISKGDTYKDLDNLTVRNQGVLSTKGVAEINTVTLGGGTVQVEADSTDAENTGNVTIASLHGQGNVIGSLYPGNISSPVILPHNGRKGGTDAVGWKGDDAVDLISDSIGCGGRHAIGLHIPGHQKKSQLHGASSDGCGKSNADNRTDFVLFQAESFKIQTHQLPFPGQGCSRNHRSRNFRRHGGNGSSRDAHIEGHQEQRIHNHVQNNPQKIKEHRL